VVKSAKIRFWGGLVLIVAGGAGTYYYMNAVNQHKLNPVSLFSDSTPQFVSPAEPSVGQPFTLSLRVGKDETSTAAVYYDETKYRMKKVKSDSWFDYYAAEIPGQKDIGTYYFSVTDHTGHKEYLSISGADKNSPATSDYFTIVPGFKTPAWAKGTVFYQIFPDRFYNGDPSNDVVSNEYMYDGKPVVQVKDWSKLPDATSYGSGGNRTREFYGGDLQGIIDKLPYLKQLGIQALYLNPIFVSPSNHKYDTQDYNHVDPHLGKIVHDGGKLVNPKFGDKANQFATKYIMRTEDPGNLAASDKDLQTLVQKAHAMGMKVVLDGVFNHTGSFNKWFDKPHIYPNTPPDGPGAYETQNSPFHNFYTFNSNKWPNNNSYDSWNGYNTLPKLNYEGSPKLVQTIFGIAQKWLKPPFNADGWRLDSAGDVGYSQQYNIQFWDGFRTAVKKANPNALILAEYYNDPGLYFDGKAWDSLQNYNAFLTPVSDFLTGMEVHSQSKDYQVLDNVSSFLSTMNNQMSLFPYPALYTAMNALDNHDISRFLTRTNGQIGSDDLGNQPEQASQGVHPNVLEQGVTLDMTWPGDPTVYYGDEAGVAGWTDPDSRRTFPWGNENKALENFYHKIIGVHNEYSCFKTGSLVTFAPVGENRVLVYGRFDAKSGAVTVINTSDKPQTVVIPVWRLDAPTGTLWNIVSSVQSGGTTSSIKQAGREITIVVPAGGAKVVAAKY
jgi:alpha-glucosidase